MGRLVVYRFVQVVLTLFAVTVIVFVMLHLAPGDALSAMMGTGYGRVSEETRIELRRNLGLDRPLPVQYLDWLWKALHGDLGRSMLMKVQVAPLVGERLGATAILTAGALFISVPLGILAGVNAAVRRNSIGDRLISGVATMGIGVPSFFLGIVLLIVLAVRFDWLPTSGMHSVGKSGFSDLLRHLVLPAICLAAPSASVLARMTRSSLLEVMAQGYVTTARAKGLAERFVVWRHAFRNSMVTVVTVVGLQAGFMLGGAVLVEVVFSWPGIGLLMWEAVMRRDFPVVQASVLVVASTYVLVNFFVDILYAYIDPRIRVTR